MIFLGLGRHQTCAFLQLYAHTSENGIIIANSQDFIDRFRDNTMRVALFDPKYSLRELMTEIITRHIYFYIFHAILISTFQ